MSALEDKRRGLFLFQAASAFLEGSSISLELHVIIAAGTRDRHAPSAQAPTRPLEENDGGINMGRLAIKRIWRAWRAWRGNWQLATGNWQLATGNGQLLHGEMGHERWESEE
ncbi:hypothetical protein ACMFMG_010305 [Clarireedia jacksonii]